VQLLDGTILYDARNNWAGNPVVGPHRLRSSSTDGGDSWAPVTRDPNLSGSSVQGSLISTTNLSNTLYHSHPCASWPSTCFSGGCHFSFSF
jgi:hypothetical protein